MSVTSGSFIMQDVQKLHNDGQVLHVGEDSNDFLAKIKPPLKLAIHKPCPLRNLQTKTSTYDYLCVKNKSQAPCTERVCLGSTISNHNANPDVPRTKDEILQHAKDFLDQYFASIKRANTPAHDKRWQAVQVEVAAAGTYQLTETELVYGAKLAWRNASRCIGRIQWSKLQVFDCRCVTTTSGMFEALCNHIKYATNKGNIRSAITVFPQRTDGKHDFRIWNSQLISYAGYRNADGTILGDPMHVEFTEICIKLGWKPARTAWDILPLVLSANGKDPDFFEIPKEYVIEAELSHPDYDWFEELGLKWYILPAVSSMRFDCGGIEFTANAFNGWYMSTEIGCRNLCDVDRRNITELVAKKMGLDTRSPISLWRDKALVEVNVAVLHSFQLKNATIVDHHTASESFMKHLDNENRLRSGCPADWVWIVPPLSGSLTPVFHQEMAMYYLKPSYEYQEAAWKTHQWQKNKQGNKKGINRKFHFKQIARAVKFTSKLFGRALSRRIKATVLYATETGKSEQFAKKLGLIFGHAFNAQVHCMSDYDISSIEHEALLIVVTSTFGNGDPPENGESFAAALYAMKMGEDAQGGESSGSVMSTPKSFIKANSQVEFSRSNSNTPRKYDRLESLKGSSTAEFSSIDTFGPLSNVRFAVFSLGSSAYPNFCNFGKYVDNLLGELGGERLLDMATGDEMCGQEQEFNKWAKSVFNVACETFCLDDEMTLREATEHLGLVNLTEETVRILSHPGKKVTMLDSMKRTLNKKLFTCKTIGIKDLGQYTAAERTTIFVELQCQNDIEYEPGDHVGIAACNREELVNNVLKYLTDVTDPDEPVELQLLKETHTPNGTIKSWDPHERLPIMSVREIFTRCLDLTTPPSPDILQYLAKTCTDEEDSKQLAHLAKDPSAYEDWRHFRFPTMAEVLEQFPSSKPKAALLMVLLSPLQPRFYSISSSPIAHPRKIHLTVAVVSYRTQDGKGPLHYGICSNYLKDRKPGDEVIMFVRSAVNFHLPTDTLAPLILVGPGTGIAPFRGFWHHRRIIAKHPREHGPAWLFFGCRNRMMDLYKEEKDQALRDGSLDKTFLALSREDGVKKTYVQDLLEKEGHEIYKLLLQHNAHFYVCGDCKMAEDVLQKLIGIIKKYSNMTEEQVYNYIYNLKDENRYHEDIFGITLRTAEVHNASRENARIKLAAQP